MDYEKGTVYKLMDQGGPTDTRESYFKEAGEEMIRARTLCTKANATLPSRTSKRRQQKGEAPVWEPPLWCIWVSYRTYRSQTAPLAHCSTWVRRRWVSG